MWLHAAAKSNSICHVVVPSPVNSCQSRLSRIQRLETLGKEHSAPFQTSTASSTCSLLQSFYTLSCDSFTDQPFPHLVPPSFVDSTCLSPLSSITRYILCQRHHPSNMVYSISYRRPAYVSFSSGASINSEKSANADSVTSRSSCPYGIPEALSFDRIIDGGTCPVSRRLFPSIKGQSRASVSVDLAGDPSICFGLEQVDI
jgi:hypothetical protein